jgi:hypothetical protein
MQEDSTIYIAYGGNLNLIQMAMMCPTATVIGKSALNGYRLLFRGDAGYARATVEKKVYSEVPILAWGLKPGDEKALDRYKGYPRLYRKEYADVELEGRSVKTMVYIMNEGRPLDAPGKQYLCTIASGYVAAGFDMRILERAVRESTRRDLITVVAEQKEKTMIPLAI